MKRYSGTRVCRLLLMLAVLCSVTEAVDYDKVNFVNSGDGYRMSPPAIWADGSQISCLDITSEGDLIIGGRNTEMVSGSYMHLMFYDPTLDLSSNNLNDTFTWALSFDGGSGQKWFDNCQFTPEVDPTDDRKLIIATSQYSTERKRQMHIINPEGSAGTYKIRAQFDLDRTPRAKESYEYERSGRFSNGFQIHQMSDLITAYQVFDDNSRNTFVFSKVIINTRIYSITNHYATYVFTEAGATVYPGPMNYQQMTTLFFGFTVIRGDKYYNHMNRYIDYNDQAPQQHLTTYLKAFDGATGSDVIKQEFDFPGSNRNRMMMMQLIGHGTRLVMINSVRNVDDSSGADLDFGTMEYHTWCGANLHAATITFPEKEEIKPLEIFIQNDDDAYVLTVVDLPTGGVKVQVVKIIFALSNCVVSGSHDVKLIHLDIGIFGMFDSALISVAYGDSAYEALFFGGKGSKLSYSSYVDFGFLTGFSITYINSLSSISLTASSAQVYSPQTKETGVHHGVTLSNNAASDASSYTAVSSSYEATEVKESSCADTISFRTGQGISSGGTFTIEFDLNFGTTYTKYVEDFFSTSKSSSCPLSYCKAFTYLDGPLLDDTSEYSQDYCTTNHDSAISFAMDGSKLQMTIDRSSEKVYKKVCLFCGNSVSRVLSPVFKISVEPSICQSSVIAADSGLPIAKAATHKVFRTLDGVRQEPAGGQTTVTAAVDVFSVTAQAAECPILSHSIKKLVSGGNELASSTWDQIVTLDGTTLKITPPLGSATLQFTTADIYIEAKNEKKATEAHVVSLTITEDLEQEVNDPPAFASTLDSIALAFNYFAEPYQAGPKYKKADGTIVPGVTAETYPLQTSKMPATTDPNNDAVTISATIPSTVSNAVSYNTGAAQIEIDRNVFTLQQVTDITTFNIDLTLTDEHGMTASSTVAVSMAVVILYEVNEPPAFASTPDSIALAFNFFADPYQAGPKYKKADGTVVPGVTAETYPLQTSKLPAIIDINNDAVTISAMIPSMVANAVSYNTAEAQIEIDRNAFTLQQVTDITTFNIDITLTDEHGMTASSTVAVSMAVVILYEVNEPPAFASTPDSISLAFNYFADTYQAGPKYKKADGTVVPGVIAETYSLQTSKLPATTDINNDAVTISATIPSTVANAVSYNTADTQIEIDRNVFTLQQVTDITTFNIDLTLTDEHGMTSSSTVAVSMAVVILYEVNEPPAFASTPDSIALAFNYFADPYQAGPKYKKADGTVVPGVTAETYPLQTSKLPATTDINNDVVTISATIPSTVTNAVSYNTADTQIEIDRNAFTLQQVTDITTFNVDMTLTDEHGMTASSTVAVSMAVVILYEVNEPPNFVSPLVGMSTVLNIFTTPYIVGPKYKKGDGVIVPGVEAVIYDPVIYKLPAMEDINNHAIKDLVVAIPSEVSNAIKFNSVDVQIEIDPNAFTVEQAATTSATIQLTLEDSTSLQATENLVVSIDITLLYEINEAPYFQTPLTDWEISFLYFSDPFKVGPKFISHLDVVMMPSGIETPFSKILPQPADINYLDSVQPIDPVFPIQVQSAVSYSTSTREFVLDVNRIPEDFLETPSKTFQILIKLIDTKSKEYVTNLNVILKPTILQEVQEPPRFISSTGADLASDLGVFKFEFFFFADGYIPEVKYKTVAGQPVEVEKRDANFILNLPAASDINGDDILPMVSAGIPDLLADAISVQQRQPLKYDKEAVVVVDPTAFNLTSASGSSPFEITFVLVDSTGLSRADKYTLLVQPNITVVYQINEPPFFVSDLEPLILEFTYETEQPEVDFSEEDEEGPQAPSGQASKFKTTGPTIVLQLPAVADINQHLIEPIKADVPYYVRDVVSFDPEDRRVSFQTGAFTLEQVQTNLVFAILFTLKDERGLSKTASQIVQLLGTVIHLETEQHQGELVLPTGSGPESNVSNEEDSGEATNEPFVVQEFFFQGISEMQISTWIGEDSSPPTSVAFEEYLPLRASISDISTLGLVSIEFNQQLQTDLFALAEITEEVMILEVIPGSDDLDPTFDATKLSFTWEAVEFDEGSNLLRIQINFAHALFISSLGAKDDLMIRIRNPNLFKSVKFDRRISYGSRKLLSPLQKQMPNDSAHQFYDKGTTAARESMSAGTIFLFMLNMVFNGAVKEIMGTILSLQVIINLFLLAIPFPANSSNFVSKLKPIVSFNILKTFTAQTLRFFPLDTDKQAEYRMKILESIRNMGTKSHNAIPNLGNIFHLLVYYFLLALSLSYYKFRGFGSLEQGNKHTTLKNQLFFGRLFGILISGFLPISLSVYFQLRLPLSTTWGEKIGYAAALVFLFLEFIFFPIALLWILTVPHEVLQRPDFKKRWGLLYTKARFDTIPRRAYLHLYIFSAFNTSPSPAPIASFATAVP